MVKINELRDGLRKVDIEAEVTGKGDVREVRSRYTDEVFKVCDCAIRDETGITTLTLWNEQIDQVDVGDKIKVENGYVKSFRDNIQLNVGKYGTLIVL